MIKLIKNQPKIPLIDRWDSRKISPLPTQILKLPRMTTLTIDITLKCRGPNLETGTSPMKTMFFNTMRGTLFNLLFRNCHTRYRKKPKYGTRFLRDKSKIFKFNAW